MDSDLRKKIADNAYAQLDIKFSHIGRNTLKYDIFADSDNKNKYSLDCAGLCIEAFRLSGIDVLDIDLSNYSRRPDGSSLMRHLCTKLDRVGKGNEQQGDVLVMNFYNNPCHVCIYLGDYLNNGINYFIHASLPNKKVVMQTYDDEWKSYTNDVFTLKD